MTPEEAMNQKETRGMRIEVVPSASILPMLDREMIGARPQVSHGLVLRNGDPDFFGMLRSEKCIVDRAFQSKRLQAFGKRLKGRWFYGGMLVGHFGHVLSECVHRLWAWRSTGGTCEGVIFLLPPRLRGQILPNFVPDILSLFGIEVGNCKFVFEQIVVDELVVAEPGSHLGGKPLPAYLNYLDEMKNSWISSVPRRNFPENLFISRRGFLAKGRIAGCDYLSTVLKGSGYVEFAPQNHSIIDQLSHIFSAKRIIFEEGSSIHLLELLPRIDGRVFLIRRRPDYRVFDFTLASRVEHLFSYDNVLVASDLSKRPIERSNALSLLVEIELLLQRLTDSGFIDSFEFNRDEWNMHVRSDICEFVLDRRKFEGFYELLPAFLGSVSDYLSEGSISLS